MTWNGRPPIVICRAEVARAEPEVVGGRRAEDDDAEVAARRSASVRNVPCQTS